MNKLLTIVSVLFYLLMLSVLTFLNIAAIMPYGVHMLLTLVTALLVIVGISVARGGDIGYEHHTTIKD
jgi:uncharacterized membrane protein